MSTLLEKAKSAPVLKRHSNHYNGEHYELAVAWINGEVTTGQVATALSLDKKPYKNNTQAYSTIAVALKNASREGKLDIRLKK